MRLPDLSRLIRRRSREPQLTRDDALGSIPVRNSAIAWERQENGLVLLTVPLEVKPWMRLVKFLIQVPTERRVELDELGSEVWSWLDDQSTVRELVGRLAKKHKMHSREAEVSLTQYLETLAKRRFIGFALDPKRAQELGLTEGTAPDGESER